MTGGEAADCKAYDALIDLPERAPNALLADKGYDADAIRADLAERKIEAVIPGRSNRRVKIEHNRALYKQRNRIERMFGHLKINRPSLPAMTNWPTAFSEWSISPQPVTGSNLSTPPKSHPGEVVDRRAGKRWLREHGPALAQRQDVPVANEVSGDQSVDLERGDVARPTGEIDNGIGSLLR